MLIEIFLVPGLGFAGVLGFLVLMFGVYFIGLDYGALPAIGVFAGSMLFVTAAFIMFFKTPAAQFFVMKGSLTKSKEIFDQLNTKMKGRSVTPLYPSGKALFVLDGEEVQIDVTTQGQYIDKDFEIEIEKLEGNRVFVRSLHS